ncbi:MAG TPA: cbb3-type cytochrome c oxidase subunit II [Gammaproteobacteria bacterium]|nr:cbb3-type cytochrome c oxidase subunit II [Gammaproteobacteria bacterium]
MSKLLLIAGGSTLLYAVIATIMGVLPGIDLSQVPPGPGVEPLTELEAQGRDVYVANGCSYCHTQQVRPLPADRMFGRPSAAGDFAYQTPELLGSERNGPDLSNVGARQSSAIWQYMHLYQPRAVVPESIMPSFKFLFKVVDTAPPGVTPVPVPPAYAPTHGVVIPTPEAKALVAYLLSLKQPPLGEPGKASAHAAVMHGAAPTAEPVAKHAPAPQPKPAVAKAEPAAEALPAGKPLFSANCAACHGAGGAGIPGVFPPLKGNPAVNDADPTKHITVVLGGLKGATIDGVKYAAQMPAFGSLLSDAEIAAIINYERSAWGNDAPHVTAQQVADQRAKLTE